MKEFCLPFTFLPPPSYFTSLTSPSFFCAWRAAKKTAKKKTQKVSLVPSSS